MNIEETRFQLVQQLIDQKIPPQAIPDISEKLVSYIFSKKNDNDFCEDGCHQFNFKDEVFLIHCMRVSAKFLRSIGELKTTELLEQAADFLENKISPPKKP